MIYAIIENGKVANLVLADEPLGLNWVNGDGAAIGDVWDGETFISPPPLDADLASQWSLFRADRNQRLFETDWWAIRASEPAGTPMTDEQLAYRAALRNMDDAEDFDPFNPVWPESPAS